ncbi:hypothetical protein CWB96_15965 [Pseudoalteromonas citrea]|uniref:Uncharacterized protein n=1 Tax=Pseudoalteromonas citrea TaxID=43655 RepID=A0A5S3XMQ9_9GAMM|nr:hypothetical protein CWB97_21840 [Pseudoalteromonas citrea]TMP56003.1 hypothetical protein CWB96_15965 [Pseudoalteromonas citrea]
MQPIKSIHINAIKTTGQRIFLLQNYLESIFSSLNLLSKHLSKFNAASNPQLYTMILNTGTEFKMKHDD